MKALDVACVINARYYAEHGVRIDEMKLHKMLYFAQRESFARRGVPLFDEDILAWQFGPVVGEVRIAYRNDKIPYRESKHIAVEERKIIDYVYTSYANKKSWSLSRLTHAEQSWKKARRRRLGPGGGHRLISISDIKKDAQRVNERRHLLKELGLLKDVC